MVVSPDDFGLRGKSALVTGASRGIGRSIALALGVAGAEVALLSRNRKALEDVSAELAELGGKSVVVTCDVADSKQIERSVSTVLSEFGKIDVLVNNAGDAKHSGPFLEQTEDDWSYIMSTDLDSVVRFSRLVGRHMTEAEAGSVVNIASIAGITGYPTMSPYAVAKAGIVSLTRTLAAEWARSGVRVNAIAPGWTSTALFHNFMSNPEAAAGLMKEIPAGDWGKPDDVAGPVLFYAGDASRYVTGTCLAVDGGTTSYVGGPPTIDMLQLGRTAL